jgi:hypothetical protein
LMDLAPGAHGNCLSELHHPAMRWFPVGWHVQRSAAR